MAQVGPTVRSGLGRTRKALPAEISAMNFGSQTFSASCFDVIDVVAPRANAKSSTGMRYRRPLCMTSSHHGCSQRGLVLQPLLRHGFRTAIQRPPSSYHTLVGAP